MTNLTEPSPEELAAIEDILFDRMYTDYSDASGDPVSVPESSIKEAATAIVQYYGKRLAEAAKLLNEERKTTQRQYVEIAELKAQLNSGEPLPKQ